MRSCQLLGASNRLFQKVLLAFLLLLIAGPAWAEWMDLGGDPAVVRVLESDGQRTLLEITVGGFEADPVDIDGKTYYRILLDREGMAQDLGFPALPNVRRSIIIPDDMEMAVTVIASEYVDYTDLPVAPSKGNLLRSVNPDKVPYTFDRFYQTSGTYPRDIVETDPPHIIRDYRGLVVDANVFRYTPATNTLRVYTRLTVEVAPVGPGRVNVLQRTRPFEKLDPQFDELYANHFLNYGDDRYTPVMEAGGMLIISYDAFLGAMQPLVEWKNQKGLPTTIVGLGTVGSTWTLIQAYIQNEYDSNGIAYVLLVGDDTQMPKPSSDSDPVYSLVAGGDSYPDIFVGRFSAENATHVQTQVDRTITYERDQVVGATWPQYGFGVASNEGPGHFGEYDYEHLNNIRTDLLGYGYLGVDQIYDPGATAAQVTTAVNAGRGIGNYTGHGSVTAWSTTGFSNTNVDALTNDNMLPFICSVACNNGTFTGTTCFGEAWLRASNGGTPTGAIATYMSYISQSWDPPMYAQDEVADLLVTDQKRTVGGLWFNGSCHMIDATGSTGVNEFRNWMIFGDPSVAVRTKAASDMVVAHSGALLIGQTNYDVNVTGVAGALCALYASGTLYGTGTTDGAGYAQITLADPPDTAMDLTLTVTAYNMVTNIGTVSVLPPSGPYLSYSANTVLDYLGNNDGVLDADELVDLEVVLENVGIDAATNVVAYLSTADGFAHVAGSSDIVYPDIPASGFGTPPIPWSVKVHHDCPDQHVVQFDIHITADQGTWDTTFSLTVDAPLLQVVDSSVSDVIGGNGSGTADAGETIHLDVDLGNIGHSDANLVTGVLSCSDVDVIVQDPDGICATVPEGGFGILGTYAVEILATYPEPGNLEFQLDISLDSLFVTTLFFEIPVGGWFDDMEADRGWTVGAPGDVASSGIWECADPVGTEYSGIPCQMEDDHTPAPGTLCYVTGNGSVGGAAGENDVDGGKTTLLSPVFQLAGATGAEISYWRYFSNNAGNNPDQDYWDVEVTDDGVDWVSLEHTLTTEALWVQKTFELSSYVDMTDQVQVRFIAQDDASGSLVEAGVDDFLLSVAYDMLSDAGDERAQAPARLALGANYPNPFNPKTTVQFELPKAGQVDLAIYDVTGRRIVTLVKDQLAPGLYRMDWMGRDGNGRQVASGIYFSRLQFGEKILTQKMTLLK
ncbi:MAG: C25 family cysteine peptidase [bacterium]